LSFVISHLPFIAQINHSIEFANNKWEMKNDKWKIMKKRNIESACVREKDGSLISG